MDLDCKEVDKIRSPKEQEREWCQRPFGPLDLTDYHAYCFVTGLRDFNSCLPDLFQPRITAINSKFKFPCTGVTDYMNLAD